MSEYLQMFLASSCIASLLWMVAVAVIAEWRKRR
jgi:arginine exporter protein ArgO